MIDNPLALTFDFGTQSLRVALTDKKGNIVAMVKNRYNPVYISKEKGYAEQDPDYYVSMAKSGLKTLCAEHKDLLKNIIGATITCFRDSSVQLDENYKPLRNCILWLDQRMAKAKEKLPLWHWMVYSIVGMKETIKLNRERTIAHWIKENEPEIWMKTKKYVQISTYITYKLTGVLSDSSASVIGHYPLNFKTGRWYPKGALKGSCFGIPPHMLSELKHPGQVIATISDAVADECGLPHGIQLYASGSDKACETIGLGALNSDTAAVSYGTASTIEVSSTKYIEPERFLPAYPAAVPGWYNSEVQIYRGYWMLSWFSKNFASDVMNESKITQMATEDLLNSKLSQIPPGSDGLVLQPYWGPGLSRPLSKGAIIGFSDIHTREHMYRAIIEGIGYGLREGLDSIQSHQRHKVSSIRISGGGSQSDSICQITADIFGLPVSRVQTFETTTLGAAISLFLATKVYQNIDEATSNMVHQSTVFYPNNLAHQQYDYLYHKIYVHMYPQLKWVYKDLNKYGKKY